jgi:hypothetical protein
MQDEEREQLRKLSQQPARSFTGVAGLARITAMPELTLWAEQQRHTMQALFRSFVVPRLSEQIAGSFITPRLSEQIRARGLAAGTRRHMFPVLEATLAQKMTLPNYSALFAQRVRLPDASYGALSQSLQQSLRSYETQTVAPALQTLAQSQTFSIAQWEAAYGRLNDLSSFERHILPLIRQVPLRRLMEATGLSLRYVSQIRRGERSPHPKHWSAFRTAAETHDPGRARFETPTSDRSARVRLSSLWKYAQLGPSSAARQDS